MHTQRRIQQAFPPADYIGTFGGALLPEMFSSVTQYDTGSEYVIELAVPGMRRDDIKVTLKNPVLWITAQPTRIDPASGNRIPQGLPYQRSFIVPRSCESATLFYECYDGLLTIRLRKSKKSYMIFNRHLSDVTWLKMLQTKAAPFFRLLNRSDSNQRL